MKTPEYVATVTRIYRKYIDLAYKGDNYSIEEKDLKDLLQVFNRGNFSTGHLGSEPNKDLIFSKKPNNMGLYLGNISNYNPTKGYITIELNQPIAIGDQICIEGESGNYTVSELIKNNSNLKTAELKSIVKLGRMKGNIKIGSKVYKTSSKTLSDNCRITYSKNANFKRIPIDCCIEIKKDTYISVKLKTYDAPFYDGIKIVYTSDVKPEISINRPTTKDTIVEQFSKIGNTPYKINNIVVNIEDGLFINIKTINEVRRNAIQLLMQTIISSTISNRKVSNFPTSTYKAIKNKTEPTVSILLQTIHTNYDYSLLKGFDNLYIPLKYLANKKYKNILKPISEKFNMYVYMPTIIKANYKNLMLNNLDEIIENYNIKGFVISNVAGIQFLKKYMKSNKFKFIANYTMNIFNNFTIKELKNIGITEITPSIEANSDLLHNLIDNSPLPTELIAYGRAVLMNSSYCLLGKTNKCYPECKMKCTSGNKYYLKDRLGICFRILPDNMQTVTSIYNSKITSIDTSDFNISSLRIDILDENIEEINNIASVVKSRKKIEGKNYTNGNLKREI